MAKDGGEHVSVGAKACKMVKILAVAFFSFDTV
jgi:hypothetical protein